MFLIGLTGGIASGKSTVAKHLAALGAETIDADQVARDVVLPGSQGLNQIVKSFGPEVLNAAGGLSREALAEIVFPDPTKRLELEAILHPLIRARTMDLISRSQSKILVYAVPLLVEANVDYPFDMVVTVEAGVENQIARLMTSRGLTENQAQDRIEAQASEQQRVERADYRIDSSGTLENLERQVGNLWTEIQNAAKQKGNSGTN
ncbi:unannotated protein [freshwater metagenome]|uniref:Unannotated protein n=1 Tax=freshwater metagenome TaxID=449393 RepID=A0A6J6ICK3_9ZZZZ|nr:dephospho-CoA kinase [Actinomycetota bacterium]